ncbi:M48 family metalloprotease [Desulfovibrio sp. OttesenSCG-928-C06]|nr:M48 family metalloprotease [Desulfovibrio sp. OttesenSCG-928-C06]
MGFTLAIHKIKKITVSRAARHGRMVLLAALLLCLLIQPVTAMQAQAALFGEFTVADEAKLGKEFDIMVRSRLPLVQDPEILGYFESMVQRLSTRMPPQPFQFQTSIIRHNAVNAFAVPGGYIFIHTGLITAMEDEAAVAGVLAHEMAHVTQRHIASRIERSQAISLLSMVGALAGAFLGGDAGSAAIVGSAAAAQAAMLNYSRSDESEADQVGMSYLMASGYRPIGMVEAFQVLSRPQWITGSDFPSYLSTHPAITERISDMSARLRQTPKQPVNKNAKEEHAEFLRIQTLVRGRYANYETALQYFSDKLKTEKDKKNLAIFNMGMGILHNRRNQVKDATTAFKKAVELNAKDAIILREAGRFHYLKGSRDEALKLLSSATSINRHDYLALFYYARLLDDSGKTGQAITYYQNILRYIPEDSEVHLHYSQALGRTGQMFYANLHMAYSALYDHNQKRLSQFHQRAQKLANTPQEQAALEAFDKKYEERRAYWK